MNRTWAFLVLGLFCLLVVAPDSQATPLSGTVLTAPGSTVFPGLVAPGTPAGTLLASLVSPYSFATTAGTTSGTLTSAVYRNPSGTLDFYYQVANSATSATAIARETNTSFTGFTTSTGFRLDAVGPFVAGTVAPVTADRNIAGSVIGFDFNPPDASKILPGLTSGILVISTDAATFTAGNAVIIDGGTQIVAAFQPAVPVPTFSKTIATPFGAGSINQGDTTSVTFTVTNPNSTALTGLSFTDTLPSGLSVQNPNGLTNSCGGTVTAVSGTGTISLTGGSVGPLTSCAISVKLTGIAPGNQTNPSVTLTSNEAPPVMSVQVGVFVYAWWLVFFY